MKRLRRPLILLLVLAAATAAYVYLQRAPAALVDGAEVALGAQAQSRRRRLVGGAPRRHRFRPSAPKACFFFSLDAGSVVVARNRRKSALAASGCFSSSSTQPRL